MAKALMCHLPLTLLRKSVVYFESCDLYKKGYNLLIFHAILPKHRGIANRKEVDYSTSVYEMEKSDEDIMEKMNHKIAKRITARLSNLLLIDNVRSQEIIKQYPMLLTIPETSIVNTYHTLRENGISDTCILNNIWLLSMRCDKLQMICSLREKTNDIEMYVSLLQLGIPSFNLTLKVFETPCGKMNRVDYFAKRLKVTVTDVCQALVKNQCVLKIGMAKVIKILDLFDEYGMDTRCILSDFWVFQYSPETVRKRFNLINGTGHKPWIVRCPQEVIQKYMQKLAIPEKILGTKTVDEYLSARLNIEKTAVSNFIRMYPEFNKISIKKVDAILSILLHHQYSAQQILFGPKVFSVKPETLERRICEYKEIKNGDIPKIPILYAAESTFKEYKRRALHDM